MSTPSTLAETGDAQAAASLFYAALENLFIGVPVEGQSGYVNLMRLKSRYYREVFKPGLERYIAQQLADFPEFRAELFDKLYSFFRRYFAPNGSLGFFFTPYHEQVYARVYSDDRDVALFWKTAPLYYLKTDRLFQPMTIELGGWRFHFDVSQVEHKRSNEKRQLVYTLAGVDGNCIHLQVCYGEGHGKTDVKGILKALRGQGVKLPEETLRQALHLFARQGEIDFFLCKDARGFLREQFDLWLWQYLLEPPGKEPEDGFSAARLAQLQVLKRVAYRVIDFIAAFEGELVKIWHKPKFVLQARYVMTLDRLWQRNPQVVEQLLAHPGMAQQVQEWRSLGLVDGTFQPSQALHPDYQFLPIDTGYFPDMERLLVGLFDGLEQALDGWLIKSENYQALCTLLPKWRGRVKCIYIDPPFNKDQEADYPYMVNYKDATWITLLENRLGVARELLCSDGHLFVRCDYAGNAYVRLLLNHLLGQENFRNEIIVKRGANKAGLMGQFQGIRSLAVGYDNLYWYTRQPETRIKGFFKTAPAKRQSSGSWVDFHKGAAYDRPTMRYEILGITLQAGQWKWCRERAMQAVANYQRYLEESRQTGETLEAYWRRHGCRLEFIRREGERIKYWVHPREQVLLDNVWLDIAGYSSRWGFLTENAEALLERIIAHVTEKGDVVMDFFLGSGTTVAVAHKLRRKWIGIEMGEHFYTVVLPRMKKVLWETKGGFFKYFELEQYEQTLARCTYSPELAVDGGEPPLGNHLKLLDAVTLAGDDVQLQLERLYPGIDLGETVSLLLGVPIQKATPEGTMLADGTQVESLPAQHFIPLLWW